jgi:hypothetical protein
MITVSTRVPRSTCSSRWVRELPDLTAPMRDLDRGEGCERAFQHLNSRVLAGVGFFVPAVAPDVVVEAIMELPQARRTS